MRTIERRIVPMDARPILGTYPDGSLIAGPLRDEVRIIDDVLREAGVFRSLVWVEAAERHRPHGNRIFHTTTEPRQQVLVSGMWWHPDGGRFWMHVSVTVRAGLSTRVPTYDELAAVKATFLGPHLCAVQVFPRAADHVNIHPHVLHLWACLTEDVVPNFGEGGTI